MKKSLGAKILAMPCPVWVIGSWSEDGKPNAMTIAWGGICCSKPVMVTASIRKERHTYENIMRTKSFTVNIPIAEQAKEVDYFGMASGRDADKFATTGLTAVKSDVVDAPYIAEFPLVIECRLDRVVELGAHDQVIGEVMDVKADEKVLEGDIPALTKVAPLLFAPGDGAYFRAGEYLGKAFSIGRGYMD